MVLVLVGALFGATSYYRAHALPNTTVGSVSISGMTKEAAIAALEDKVGDPEIKVVTPEQEVTVPLSQTGVTLDAQGTIDAALYGSGNPTALISSLFNPTQVSLQAAIDEAKFAEFAQSLEPSPEVGPKDAQVRYQDDHFAVTPASSGATLDVAALHSGVLTALREGTSEIQVGTVTAEPKITTEEAELAAQTAQKWLDSKITLSDGAEMTSSPDAPTIASWVTFTAGDKDLTPAIDSAQVNKWVEDFAKSTEVTPGEGIRNLDANGQVVATVIAPTTGLIANNADQIAAEIVQAIPSGSPLEATIKYDEKEGGWQERAADPATEGMLYRAAPGEKWIEVDIGGANVKAYEGSHLVATYPMVAGKASTPTIEGEFNVYLKYDQQDMGCTAEWSYCARGVPWVSYFSGSYALHGSSSWQSGFGDPNTRLVQGSAGCVNMRDEDAHELYQWADMGTKVISHA